jgi:hypothetical protein
MQDFEKLINKEDYQVFLFCSPAYFPFSLFCHSWFVVNKKGEISRWKVRHIKNKENGLYVFKNFQEPFEGVQVSFFIKKYWKAKLLGQVGRLIAEKVIQYIENSESNYPYKDKYIFIGPNSNTYVQWVLNQSPEFNVRLSWRFIGKNYKLI